jgi:hypothetical protein
MIPAQPHDAIPRGLRGMGRSRFFLAGSFFPLDYLFGQSRMKNRALY